MHKTALQRLLNVLPVSALRKNWEVAGKSKGDVITSVTSKALEENVIDFVYENIGLTKQHVYLFSHRFRRSSEFPDTFLKDYNPEKVASPHGGTEHFYLIPLEFHYVAGSPPVEGTELFLWPVRIAVRAKILIAYLTTMEKDISTYVQLHPIHKVKRTLQNEQVLRILIETCGGSPLLTRLDIHRGVKHLWETNAIDASQVSWKDTHSTHTDSMDSEFLLKKDDPSAYREASKAQLLKTVFKVVDKKQNWPELFMIDVGNGEIGFPRFNKDEKAVENVVGEILKFN